jgi:vacuolar protein sorting-associated protein 33A
MTYTSTQSFIRVLEAQQSKYPIDVMITFSDLVAGFEASSQSPLIDDLMGKNVPLTDVLRLLCLQSLVGGGLKQKEAEGLRRQFLQVNLPFPLLLTSRRTAMNI